MEYPQDHAQLVSGDGYPLLQRIDAWLDGEDETTQQTVVLSYRLIHNPFEEPHKLISYAIWMLSEAEGLLAI